MSALVYRCLRCGAECEQVEALVSSQREWVAYYAEASIGHEPRAVLHALLAPGVVGGWAWCGVAVLVAAGEDELVDMTPELALGHARGALHRVLKSPDLAERVVVVLERAMRREPDSSTVWYVGVPEDETTSDSKETSVFVKIPPRDGHGGRTESRPLDPRLDLRRHSPNGFNWGYSGSGPAQLALAICADYYQRRGLIAEEALRVYQRFKRQEIATLPSGQPWLMSFARVGACIRACELNNEARAETVAAPEPTEDS